MKQSFVTKIRYIKNGEFYDGNLKCIFNSDLVNFQFTYEENIIIISNQFPFFALVELRLQLEQKQIKIVCEGSRYDVYPSGMQLDSFAACELEISKPVTNLVDILDDTQLINKISTVKEQENFYNKWLESLNLGDVIWS